MPKLTHIGYTLAIEFNGGEVELLITCVARQDGTTHFRITRTDVDSTILTVKTGVVNWKKDESLLSILPIVLNQMQPPSETLSSEGLDQLIKFLQPETF